MSRLGSVLKTASQANLREVRIHLCQSSISSEGTRDFIKKNLPELKSAVSASFPLLVRECSGINPKIYTRYRKGVEHSADLSDMDATQVEATLIKLADIRT